MKPQKNKIVFTLVLVGVVLFVAVYSILTFGKDKKAELKPDSIPMPDLEQNQEVYESKMEALDAIETERERTAPQIYPDHMVDDKGYFNPDYMEYEKNRIIDSIYQSKNFDVADLTAPIAKAPISQEGGKDEKKEGLERLEQSITTKEMALQHQLFFASEPEPDGTSTTDGWVVYVDGRQTIRSGQRLNLRLPSEIILDKKTIPKGSRVYGFVQIGPNRMMLEISMIGEVSISLKGYDMQDGREGIYVKNNLMSSMVTEGLENSMGSINLPGMPQLSGLKGIFRRGNRTIKITVPNNYQLMLKPQR